MASFPNNFEILYSKLMDMWNCNVQILLIFTLFSLYIYVSVFIYFYYKEVKHFYRYKDLHIFKHALQIDQKKIHSDLQCYLFWLIVFLNI